MDRIGKPKVRRLKQALGLPVLSYHVFDKNYDAHCVRDEITILVFLTGYITKMSVTAVLQP